VQTLASQPIKVNPGESLKRGRVMSTVPPRDQRRDDVEEPDGLATQPSSKPNLCFKRSLIAFHLTLLLLGLGAVLAFAAVASLGSWQLGGRANPTAERLATLSAILLFAAMIPNATAFAIALWGWRKGESVSWFIVGCSGLGIVASVACGLSSVP
jgi:hypothetical protein